MDTAGKIVKPVAITGGIVAAIFFLPGLAVNTIKTMSAEMCEAMNIEGQVCTVGSVVSSACSCCLIVLLCVFAVLQKTTGGS